MDFIKYLFFFVALCLTLPAHYYKFADNFLDVVIPCHSKDFEMLEDCIEGIKENGKNIRRVIVVSDKKISDNAEFFSEDLFPFSKESIYENIVQGRQLKDKTQQKLIARLGWIFQQLIKIYASYIIPDLSENVLILDADTVFFRPVCFLDSNTNSAFFNPGKENHSPYFVHGSRLLPGFKRMFPDYSGISHHMLLQRPVLDHLFSIVEQHHNDPFWVAFCKQIDPRQNSCCSEYEVYFNFAISQSDQFTIRKLKWANVGELNKEKNRADFDYLSCHSYQRDKHKKKILRKRIKNPSI